MALSLPGSTYEIIHSFIHSFKALQFSGEFWSHLQVLSIAARPLLTPGNLLNLHCTSFGLPSVISVCQVVFTLVDKSSINTGEGYDGLCEEYAQAIEFFSF